MAEARYDAIADFYVSWFDSLGDPASAALLELLGPPAGLHILDVGCGHGRITRELARRGAGLTGIDISGALIGKARQAERAEPLGIRYVHADVTSPGGLDAAFYDAVTCNFALSACWRRPLPRFPRRQMRQGGHLTRAAEPLTQVAAAPAAAPAPAAVPIGWPLKPGGPSTHWAPSTAPCRRLP